MSLLINLEAKTVVEDDFETLPDDQALPAGAGGCIVSLARWNAEREQLLATGRAMGVELPNTMSMFDLDRSLLDRPLLALSFPTFSDGRALSQARILRQKWRVKGRLRAEGHVLPDQLINLLRCGFSEVKPAGYAADFAASMSVQTSLFVTSDTLKLRRGG
ncbi:MAG: DUF934 domain-containing protein [Pseudomonadota bacterium]